MTSVLNENRFMYIEPLENGNSLPCVNYSAVIRCLSFHYGQRKIQRNLTSAQCWDTGHTRNNCKNEPRCKVCKTAGHQPGDPMCTFYQIQKSVVAFNSENNILLNFYPCKLNVFGVQHKSAEHAFQNAKSLRCGDLDAAKSIQESKDTLSAKHIGVAKSECK